MLRNLLALSTLALLLTPLSVSAQAKMGSNMICYEIGDPYYDQIHTNRVYPTLVECESDGGVDRQTANDPTTMGQVETGRAHRGRIVAPVSTTRMAQRFVDLDAMDDWILDTRSQGCREQRDVLLAHSSNVTVQWHAGGCRVRMGHWRDAIDGKRLTDPETIEITHLVPLSWAMAHGAGEWTAEMRHRFYMDRRNLVTTTAQGRAAMEGHTPIDWRPYLPQSACYQAQTFWTLTQAYPFTLSQEERLALVAAVNVTCQPVTRDDITAMRHAQNQLSVAQREALDEAQQTYDAQADVLRAQNAPPAPAYIRLPDGSTRALTMEERWGATWRTHVHNDLVRQGQIMRQPITGETLPQDPTQALTATLPKPPIALPGTYVANPTANAETAPGQNTMGAQGNAMSTGTVNVGGPNDFGDFGDFPMTPEMEALGRLGDDLPELDNPGENPEALQRLMREGLPGMNMGQQPTQPSPEQPSEDDQPDN